MNKELVRQWVEALRSGKYKQGRLSLRDINDKFCCLGVLCDIAKGNLNLDWRLGTSEDICYEIEDTTTVVPESILEFLGVNIHKAFINAGDLRYDLGIPSNESKMSLIDLNDYYKVSFNEIADIIEEEFLK